MSPMATANLSILPRMAHLRNMGIPFGQEQGWIPIEGLSLVMGALTFCPSTILKQRAYSSNVVVSLLYIS